MEIIYITGAAYPSKSANCIQVIKMCSAFSRMGNEVTFFAGAKFLPLDILSEYGKSGQFQVVLTKRLNVRIIGAFLYSIAVVAKLFSRRKRVDVFYTRDQNTCLLLCFLGLPVIYEVHSEPSGIKKKIESSIFKASSLKGEVTISKSLECFYSRDNVCRGFLLWSILHSMRRVFHKESV